MKVERKPKFSRDPLEEKKLAERKHKADELAARSGVPLQVAFSIVDGKTTLDAALKSMMIREKSKRIVEQHGLTPSLAGQVARGQLPLEKVLARHMRRSSGFWKSKYSIFDSLSERTEPIGLARFGLDWAVGKVGEVRRYEFDFSVGDDTACVQKHDVKFLVEDAAQMERIRSSLGTNEEVKAKNLGSTINLDERYHVDKEKFFEAVRENAILRFIFRDGDVLTGRVVWFARYEFCVEIQEALHVVGFLHALWNWDKPNAKEPAPAAKEASKHKGKAHAKKKRATLKFLSNPF